MKTLKRTTAISLLLILAGINAIYAAQKGSNFNNGKIILVRYQVSIHLPIEIKLCNLYIVRVTDAYGNNIAPPQSFSASVSKYNFYEAGPFKGVRTARLEIMPNGENFLCAPELSVLPDFISGLFLNGQTYLFELYPTKEGSK